MTHTFVITAKFCLCLVMWLIWKFGLRCSAGDNKNILAAMLHVKKIWNYSRARDVASLQRDLSWEAKMIAERREAKTIINNARSVGNFFQSHIFSIFFSRGNGLIKRRNNLY